MVYYGMHTSTLRDYQIEAINAIRATWQHTPAAVVALPTGTGKTKIATSMVGSHDPPWLFIAHRDELIEQIYQALPDSIRRSTRCYSGTHDGSWSHRARHAIATVQWLTTGDNLNLITYPLYIPYGTLVIDECHHAVADSYRQVIGALRTRNPAAHMLGLTATVARADGVPLAEVFGEIAYHRPIKWFVDHGHLVPAESYSILCDLDLSNARTSEVTGDFIWSDDLLRAVDASNWLEVVSDAWLERALDLKTIAFFPSIRHSQEFATFMQERGIQVVHVDGETPPDERRRINADYAAGRIQMLCNVGIYNEGYDEPTTGCILMARPTKSQLFYIQCVGRALRPSTGKERALILDFASNDHSLVQLADLDGDFSLRRLRDNLHSLPGWGTAFYDAVFLSLVERRAILHFAVGNAYARAVELLRHPKLAWACFDDCAILDVSDDHTLFVLSPARARQIHGALRPRLRTYMDAGLYVVLVVNPKEIKIVGVGTPDDIVEIASDYAEAVARKLADGRARWRREPPSDKQMWYATTKLNLDPARLVGLNRGDLSAIISYVHTCQRLGVTI